MVTPSQISEIITILSEQCKPEKIILFGSYANGTATENSDLDLAIIKKTNLPGYKRPLEFRKALRLGHKKWLFPMDIIVYTPEEIQKYGESPLSFIHEIFTTGKVMYES
jgi:uncharacterized protein